MSTLGQPLPAAELTFMFRLARYKVNICRQDGDMEDNRWQEEQERRKQRVIQVCKNYQDLTKVKIVIINEIFFFNSQVPKLSDLKAWIYSGQHRLLYCRHSKVQVLQVQGTTLIWTV